MDNFKKIFETTTPIWFMRQAGRYLPEYRKIRVKEKNFLDLCFNPELAAEISLQPISRFNFDFIILFSDILVVPYGLGKKVDFKENIGPILEKTNNFDELKDVDLSASIEKLEPVMRTIKILKNEKKNKQLIGFCGGPFTVLTYMFEGGTSKKHDLIKKKIKAERKDFKLLLNLITEFSIAYLKKQILNGVDIVKIFESWAGLLNKEDYNEFIIEPNRKIQKEIKKKFPEIPMIFFPRESKEKIFEFLEKVKPDVLSLDKEVPNKIFEVAKKKKIILQGNLDPLILIEGGRKLEDEVKKIMLHFSDNDHIFNLSHGILPKTPIDNVKKTLEIVKNFNETR
ncbi:MAG: uroporphyrinogen decarboxylase [Alphaproteobacteria bacterium]|nr:uroporphyrinogen decarboxylase [Alphaproteobacteria bacterium]